MYVRALKEAKLSQFVAEISPESHEETTPACVVPWFVSFCLHARRILNYLNCFREDTYCRVGNPRLILSFETETKIKLQNCKFSQN